MSLASSVKRFYLARVHQIRSALTFVMVVGAQVAAAGPDVAATWTAKQWAFHILFGAAAAVVPLMRAGEFNPAPPAPSAAPDPTPKQAAFAQLGLVLALLIVLVVAVAVPFFARGAVPCPSPSRSQAQLEIFKAQWSAAHDGRLCPQGPAAGDALDCRLYHRVGRAFVLYEACGACEVDHLCSLACCGADDPSNMHWMDKHANRAKGADCTACAAGP